MDINHQHHLKLTTSTWEPTMPNMDDHIFHNQQQQQEDACFNHHHHIWPSFPLQNPHHKYHVIPSSSNQLQQQVLPFDHVVNNHVQTLLADPDQERDEDEQEEEAEEELGAMKEMMFKIAAMQPVDIDPATIRKPKRRNVRISNDPQSVAARLRRERISEKIRILQRLVPGGTKMDTASMLDEAIRYVKFLKRQIRQLQSANHHLPPPQVPVPPCPSNENWANNNIVTPAKALVLGSSSTMVTPNASDPMYEVIGN